MHSRCEKALYADISFPRPQKGCPEQLLPSLLLENVSPEHGLHWRSAVALPSVDRPSPATHVAHVAQTWLPTLRLNWPVGQEAQEWSREAVASTLAKDPALHRLLTGMQESPLFDGEKSAPIMHDRHDRSFAVVPAASCPALAPHSDHAAQG